MKIKKSELLEVLSKVRPALSDKAIIEQTDHFVFDNDYVRTYNDRIAISYPFKTDIRFAIKADEFFKLISRIEIEEMEIEMEKDGGVLNILSGKAKGRIVVVPEVKCPTIIIKARRWFLLPKNFSDAIRFCSFSADRNMLVKELMCLWVKETYVISSDGFRVTKFELDSKLPEFLLPATTAQELAKYLPTHYIIEAESAWIHFKNIDGVIFSSRVVEGNYPEAVWDVFTMKGDKVIIPEGLKGAVERASVLAQVVRTGAENDLIEIGVKDGEFICKGGGVLGDWVEPLSGDYKKKDFEAKISFGALLEILSYAEKEMRVSDDKVYFSGPNFEHVISLL